VIGFSGSVTVPRPPPVRARQPRRAPSFDLPLTEAGVRAIATAGFPLDEPVPELELRNRRVTLGYGELSNQLAGVIAGGGDRVANWCTFATWSSKSIGSTIDPDEIPPGLRQLPVPSLIRRYVVSICRRIFRRQHGAIFRALACGNRLIFLEVGVVSARFVEAFAVDDRSEPRWDEYWRSADVALDEIARLDGPWVPTKPADRRRLHDAMRCYFDAAVATEAKRRGELVLAGNVELAAYEQERAQGYLAVVLAFFCGRAMNRLLTTRSGEFAGSLMRLSTEVCSRIMTRFGIALILPNEVVDLARRQRMPVDGSCAVWPDDQVTESMLRDLLRRYDRSPGAGVKRGARSWLSFDERMHVITNLFRAHHGDGSLFARPFSDVDTTLLRSGTLNTPAARLMA
jgi:hypothetical protein